MIALSPQFEPAAIQRKIGNICRNVARQYNRDPLEVLDHVSAVLADRASRIAVCEVDRYLRKSAHRESIHLCKQLKHGPTTNLDDRESDRALDCEDELGVQPLNTLVDEEEWHHGLNAVEQLPESMRSAVKKYFGLEPGKLSSYEYKLKDRALERIRKDLDQRGML